MITGQNYNLAVGCLIVGVFIGIVWALIVAAANGGRLP